MNKWNIRRYEIDKFFKLLNGQYLKILFTYIKKEKVWSMSIIVANNKRKCNDCARKSELSPKVFYGKVTGRGGLEPFIIALKELINFEKNMKTDCEIRITATNDRLQKIYNRLTKYGYKKRSIIFTNGRERTVFYKTLTTHL